MTFPCLICGELPIIPEQPSASGQQQSPAPNLAGKRTGTGTTIRTLSKDVSDKIFQNLCRHLYVKTEPFWFIQNPGEQMPLCASCSAVVLEVYTLQTKVDHLQIMIKQHISKLERVVADTEIASNWMATRDEQESEESMWNSLDCPPLAIRYARERHHKFRHQVLQNFKSQVKLRQSMRSTDQLGDSIPESSADAELTCGVSFSLSDPLINGAKQDSEIHQHLSPVHQPVKRSRVDDAVIRNATQVSGRSNQTSTSPLSIINISSQQTPLPLSTPPSSAGKGNPPVISICATSSRSINFADEAELSDDQNSHIFVGADVSFVKEENENDYSNSGDGDQDELLIDQNTSYWNAQEDNFEDEEEDAIPEGEEVVWFAPGVALRKSLVDQFNGENLKASVYLRKLAFAMFGLKRIAESSGISGSNKPGSKPSLDRYKFEALREYIIDKYGIRDNNLELDDLNRKIRTICCDARKTMKRRCMRPNPNPPTLTPIQGQGGSGSLSSPSEQQDGTNPMCIGIGSFSLQLPS